MRDGRIAYVDFGNVAQLSQTNKQILVDAVVHAVNEDYVEMANDFIKLGFLGPGNSTQTYSVHLAYKIVFDHHYSNWMSC